MRLRCIVFFLPAAFIAGLIFLLASSIVSALEGSLASAFEPSPPPFSVVLVGLEDDCGLTEDRGVQVSRDFDSCDRELPLPGRFLNDGPADGQSEGTYLF